jgi:hypothetical protein
MISSELPTMEVLFYVAKKCISINLIRTAASLSNCKQTKHGPEYFHAHFDGQFYTHHANVFICMDLVQKI